MEQNALKHIVNICNIYIYIYTKIVAYATETMGKMLTLDERRYISDVVLKNVGSMMQICRNINVHVVNTDIC